MFVSVCPENHSMSLHPQVQQLIRQVEALSGRLVHVTEDPSLKVMAKIITARGAAPAHFVSYRPGTQAVDYLVAYQLGFLVRLFSLPADQRWEVTATPAQQQAGIAAMGLSQAAPEFAQAMINNIITQVRTYSIGSRVDDWIWIHLPELREQQEYSVRSQLAENSRALAPEIRQKFPKALVDTNTAMNAAYATPWGAALKDERFKIPYLALGYAAKSAELLAVLQDLPGAPTADRALVEGWAQILGLRPAIHFQLHLLT